MKILINLNEGHEVSESRRREQYTHADMDKFFNAMMSAVKSRLDSGKIKEVEFKKFKRAMDSLGETVGFKALMKKHLGSPTTAAAQMFHKAVGQALPGLRDGSQKHNRARNKSMQKQSALRAKRGAE